jgi:uncharacterized phage protein gp47/JayE
MAVTPKIIFPTDKPGYSTNLTNQTISGNADISTVAIRVNGSSANVSYTPGSSVWTFNTELTEGNNIFNIVAVDNLNSVSSPATLTVTLTSESSLNLKMTSPTGLVLDRSKDSVIISVIKNPELELIGYNFYGSENVGGGDNGFTLLNRSIVKDISFFREENVILSQTVETSGNIKTTFTVEEVQRFNYYSFEHNRLNQPLGNKPLTEPNHYVVTAIGFDPVTLQQVESPFSEELGSSPLILDTSIKDLTIRTTTDVQQTYINAILDANPNIDVKPGTLTRDIHINPPSDEFERLYTVIDFLHRSQSFLTLLSFDDPNQDGISDPVLSSEEKLKLKEALLISDENADLVQDLIDDAFDKLAGNVNIYRKPSQASIGQALFFTRSAPIQDATINAGAVIETLSENDTAVQFRVLTDFTLRLSDIDSFYNPVTRRYEVLLDIESVGTGSIANVDADKIKIIVSGVDSLFAVTNPNPTEFGQDEESNNNLAERAILAFVSVDSGTEGGYLATTLGTPNVSRAKIISAGEDLMMRDIDPLRLIHTFGMVDIYVYGSKQTTVTENYGFNYLISKNEQVVIQSTDLYHFRVLNTDVNIDKPIFDVIEIRNVTKLATYDLTNFKIINDGQVIDLDESLETNVTIGLSPSDIISVTYRYRESEPYIFLRQPVESIVSVEGEISGPLSAENFTLIKNQDPLQFGNSTSSTDQMKINFANGIPTGGVINITDENIILFGENETFLSRYGIDADSIVVSDIFNDVIYNRDIDYIIIQSMQNEYTRIKRTPNSNILSGSNVLVDYTAGENITVRYNINSLLNDVQTRINKMKHLTADVVVKGAIKSFVDLDMKVVIEEGSDQSSIDRKIRTAVANLFSRKQIGESIYQSDIVNVVENISGVSHLIIPFTKMVKSNGSYSILENYSGLFELYQSGNVDSYKSIGTLSWPTSEGGGPINLFKGVFENDIPSFMVSSAADVSEQSGRAYIDSQGYLYVSTRLGPINNARISATYIVNNATGSRDISFSEIEYGAVGTLTITFEFIKKFRGF